MSNKEFTIVDVLYILVKWRKALVVLCLSVGIFALAFTFFMPYWYASTTTILPPADDETGFGLSSLLTNIPLGGIGASLGLGGLSEEANLFVAITNSRVMLESVAQEFDLQSVYKVKTLEEAIIGVAGHLTLDINEEGTMTLGFEYSTGYFPNAEKKQVAREKSHAIIMFIMKEFERINAVIKTKKARETRVFIEKRYLQNIDDMARAEEEFRDFQKEFGAVALENQTEALITAAAELKAQLVFEQFQLGVLQRQYDSSHPKVRDKKIEVAELDRVYNSLNKKEHAAIESSNDDIFVSIADIPDLGLEYFRLFRELTLQETIMEFILPQYEQAKIQEARDAPAVQIIDPPNIPELKSRPKRAVVIVLTVFVIGVLAAVIIILYERVMMLEKEQPELFAKISHIFEALRNDLRFKKS